MGRFPANEIISLVGVAPRYDLAESVGPDLVLKEIIDISDMAEMRLGYGTAPGDRKLRATIADAHGVMADNVVITMGRCMRCSCLPSSSEQCALYYRGLSL